jgi:hypothetical protein
MTGHFGGFSPLQNERRDIRSIAPGKEKWWYACRLFEMNRFKEGAM